MAANGSSRLATLRIIAYTLMSALVVIGVALSFVFEDLAEPPPLWAAGAVVLAGLGSLAAVSLVGYRLPALPTDVDRDSAMRLAVERYQTGLYLRFALCDATAIIALALAFAAGAGGMLLFVLGAVIALALMSVHVLPGQGNIERTRQALERDGATSHLREGLEGGVS